ncbi:MAG: hypothetical protein M1835_006042 [Candelina submexicana]|nr:MAG: hypothetical protein M1835_006042 [Candelina submexicana]
MRILLGFLASTILGRTQAASSTGFVYTYDRKSPHPNRDPQKASLDTARLILAQRLGLSQYHSLGNIDDLTLQQIDAFGGERPRLLGDVEAIKPAQLLVMVDGAQNPKDKHGYLDNLRDFKHIITSGVHSYGGDGSSAIFYIDILAIIAREDGPSSESYKEAVGILREAFHNLASFAASGEQESTVIIMPVSTNTAKRSADLYEAPLSAAAFPEESATPKSGPRPSHPQVLTPTAFKSTVSVCYNHFNSCVAATNNCTGRGHCAKKYSSDNGEAAAVDCFACSCHKTTTVDDDGNVKTTFWGGPACTKKDVSMPFFLLAGFTISFILVTTFGIGLLYSIGAEELPSVIGAGVASQRAK